MFVSRRIVIHSLVVAAVLVSGVLPAGVSRANPFEWILPQTGGGQDCFEISLHNKSSRPIRVAIFYANDYQHPESSHFGVDHNPWQTAGYWDLQPGERAYVADTQNRYFYFYAENDQGGVWGGDNFQLLYGRQLGFRTVDMGGEFTDFTLNINE